MIDTIIDWMAEHLGNLPNLRIVDTRFMDDDIDLSDLELAETASHDAAACVACDGYNADEDVPLGKQVI